MSKSSRSCSAEVITGLLICVMCVPIRAQVTRDANKIILVENFMRSAFPELLNRQVQVLFSIDTQLDNDWNRFGTVGVNLRLSGERVNLEATAEAADKQLLRGLLEVRPIEGYIEMASFHGRHVSSRELETLAESAEAHPEWTDADLQAALTHAGAKYGPDQREAFLALLRIDRFATALGRIEHFTAKFVWRDLDGRVRGTPDWVVLVQVRDSRKRRVCYGLSFEPINGHLNGLGRSSRCEQR